MDYTEELLECMGEWGQQIMNELAKVFEDSNKTFLGSEVATILRKTAEKYPDALREKLLVKTPAN